jgi:hypothetical protein
MSETDTDEALPAIFEHCRTVYKEMEAEANLVSREGEGIDGSAELIWEGHLTKLFARLHLSVPYYTSVTRELKRMGCIRQRRRGGGNASSQWIILTEPTEELFRSDQNRTSGIAAKKANKLEMLEQQVKDLSRTVQKIADDYDIIITILQEKEGQA